MRRGGGAILVAVGVVLLVAGCDVKQAVKELVADQAPPTTSGVTTALSVPTGLAAAVVSSTQVNLTWAVATGPVAGYRVYRNGIQIATVVAQTSYNDTGLTAATAYNYAVAACDAAGNCSAQSTAVTATTLTAAAAAADTTPPSVPTGVLASVVSSSQINLSWSASTDNLAVTGYKVSRGGAQVATVTGTSYSDTGLTASTTYTYTVAACDAAGNCSNQSSSASATTPAPAAGADTTPPSVPTGALASAVSSSQINFSWSASTDNVAVTGYKVSRGGAQVATVTATSYSDTGLTASATFAYTVAACDAAGNCSNQSTSASATTQATAGGVVVAGDTTAPTAPTGLLASAASSSQINLAWTASTDNVGVTRYVAYRNGVFLSSTVTGTSYSDTGLTASTSYTYTVAACDAAGNCSGQSASATATTPAPPVVTFTLTVTVLGGGIVSIAPGGFTSAAGASVPVGTTSCAVVNCLAPFTSGTLVSLTATPSLGSVLTGWGGACTGTGTCAVAMTADKTVTATFGLAAPSAPTSVSATAGNAKVTISWNSVSGATSYNLYWLAGAGQTPPTVTKATGTKIATVTSPYVHTGRSNGTAYGYIVTAENAGGESPDSTQVSAIPQNLGTWTTLTAMPTARAYLAADVIGADLYAVGGWPGSGGGLTTLESLKFGPNTWSAAASMIEARQFPAAGVINNVLYAVGGTNALATLESYNPSTNQWRSAASMPTGRGWLAAGVINNILYAVGGKTSSNGAGLITLESYNPLTNSWSAAASMLTARSDLVAGVINNILYVVGGQDGSSTNLITALESYNPQTNQWRAAASMAMGRSESAAGVINGKLYVVGGYNNGALASIEVYDPATNTWKPLETPPTARYGLAAGVFGGSLYAVGGFPTTGALESFVPP